MKDLIETEVRSGVSHKIVDRVSYDWFLQGIDPHRVSVWFITRMMCTFAKGMEYPEYFATAGIKISFKIHDLIYFNTVILKNYLFKKHI